MWLKRTKSQPAIERVTRVSTVFYMGVEGLGGLEMETDEDESVSIPLCAGYCQLNTCLRVLMALSCSPATPWI